MLALGFAGHLIGSILIHWLVNTSHPTFSTNEFEQWIWLTTALGVLLVAGTGLRRRSRKAAVCVGLGAAAALVVELTVLVGWVITHSQ